MSPPQTSLAPLAVQDVSSVAGIRLVEGGAKVELASSITKPQPAPAMDHVTVIRRTPITEKPPATATLFTLKQLLPPPPRWDLATATDGTSFVICEAARGATNSLMIQSTVPNERQIKTAFPSKNYVNPRFVRRLKGDPDQYFTVTVDEKHVELFGREPGPAGYFKQRVLAEANDALAIAQQDGFILIYKVDVPGPVRGTLTFPGKLFGVRLAKDFAPLGKAVELFPDRTLFEFDADVAPTGKIVLFATSREGTFLASGDALAGPFAVVAVAEEGKEEDYAQPSVACTKAVAMLAILRHAQTDKAQVLTGSVPLT